MTVEPSRDITRIMLFVLVVGMLLLGSFWTLLPFLGGLIWATTIVVATWPALVRLQQLTGRRALATAIMTLLVLLAFIAPLVVAIAALVDAGPRHGLPLHLLPRYMDSMRVDCDERVRIASREQLDDYMEGSAATVGRVIAPLLGAPEPEAMARLGVAFQLTNFIRDVPVDWDLDRVYLPGLPEDDLRAGAASESLRERIGQEVARARGLFADSAGLALAPGMRNGVRMARAVYARVLDRVEANGYDVLGARARLRPWEAARAALGR